MTDSGLCRVLSSVEVGLALKNAACRYAHLVFLKVTFVAQYKNQCIVQHVRMTVKASTE